MGCNLLRHGMGLTTSTRRATMRGPVPQLTIRTVPGGTGGTGMDTRLLGGTGKLQVDCREPADTSTVPLLPETSTTNTPPCITVVGDLSPASPP